MQTIFIQVKAELGRAYKVAEEAIENVEQVSEELLSYWRLGIDEFILSGFPHVTECNIVSEQLLPVLKDKIDEELSV